jgi:hypothetical protein
LQICTQAALSYTTSSCCAEHLQSIQLAEGV